MSPLPSREAIPESTLLLFLALCDPFREEIPGDISQQSWEHICELSRLHGVTPFLYYRTRSLGIKLPEQIEKEWLGIYLYQLAEEKKARLQIKELKEILDPAGVPFSLLKGASAMLRLYPEPGLRTFVDLDILIPPDKVPHFKKAIMMAGYKPMAPMYSSEYEDIQKFDNHLAPFGKKDGLMIEPHLNILAGRGDYKIALPEIWYKKEWTNIDGYNFEHLNSEHFIIHMLIHCAKDLSNIGFLQIKGLIDVFYAVRRWEIDWAKVWDTARKWRVDNEILPILTTMNSYWHTSIPLTDRVTPLSLQTLFLGTQGSEKKFYAGTPARFVKRLLQTREFPDIPSRIRYLVGLFFPDSENLRWSYNVPSERSTILYYFLHFFMQSKKFFKGLWYQLLYHPKTS